jgi:CheY-like chemotaxis protein
MHSTVEHTSPTRRERPRFPLIHQIVYKGDSKPVLRSMEALSGDGLFIATPLGYEVGQLVPLILSYPGLLQPIEIAVEVVARHDVPNGLTVRVPARGQADRAKLTSLADEAIAREPKAHSGRFTVLLVEDNLVVAQIYSAALERLATGESALEVQVEFARNGKEALHLISTLPRVDLVLTDLRMPLVDGLELVRRIRSDDTAGRIPVVMITAERFNARAEAELRELRVSATLEKPLKLEDIVNTVRSFLVVRERSP